MPRLNGILETAIYVDDLARAQRFYEDILELKPVFTDGRLRAYDVGGRSILLVFERGRIDRDGNAVWRRDSGP